MEILKRSIIKIIDQVIADEIPRNIDIEVGTACNHRCVYCPVQKDPFRQKVMNMEAFNLILDKLSAIQGIKRMALNHYNEPFMDPHIVERVQAVFTRKLTQWLILYTNASMIQPYHITSFLPFRKQLGFNINLPTVVSAERYKEIHGRADLEKVEGNIDRLLAADYLVQINVQENEKTTEADYLSVWQKYKNRVAKINRIPSSTRGNLTLDKDYQNEGKIIGCTLYRQTNYLHIGVDGAVFLCAEDYYKKSQFGNLIQDSLEAVLNAPKRKAYLAYLKGQRLAPKGHICRSCKHAIVSNPATLKGDIAQFFEMATSNNIFNRF